VRAQAELVIPDALLIERAGRRFLQLVADGPSPVTTADGVGSAAGARPDTEGELLTDGGLLIEELEDPESWRNSVTEILRLIRAGTVDKVVLFRTLRVRSRTPFEQADVFRLLEQTNLAGLAYLVDGFVGVSPELLVERNDDLVRAQPMAGTMPLTGDTDRDDAAAAELFSDEKLRAEHAITIDRLHRALLGWCSYLDSEPEPSVVRAATVQHLATLVEGRLSRPVPSVLELVGALHPTPAVGGWPVAAATEIIERIEPNSRGRAGGPVGWVDVDGNGEFAVGIRCAQIDGNAALAHAGVGIVDGSDPEVEFEETKAKFKTVLRALTESARHG
jgi:isochorismate synthase